MQKFIPQLTFSDQAEEAVNFYISLFKDAKLLKNTKNDHNKKVIDFQLAGLEFRAGNGGPSFQFTPSISFFVEGETKEEIEQLYQKLSADGMVLMPLDQYPFSESFAWVQDRYGVSWQLSFTGVPQRIIPFFMFVREQHGRAEEAIALYTSLFSNSSVKSIQRYQKDDFGPEGTVQHAAFLLHGEEFRAIDSNAEHQFTFANGISFYVKCETQAEVDKLRDKLAEGGEKAADGWVKDKFGVSWQIVQAVA